MSKKLDELENSWTTDRSGDKIYYSARVYAILAHARALEDAMAVLLPIVKDAHPKLGLSLFDKLLE